MGNLLTMAEIARTLDLPESTVRYYRDRFPEFIPAVGVGRNRRYRPEALDVLRFIADAMKESTPAEGIRKGLATKFAINVEPQPSAVPQQLTATQQTTVAMVRGAFAELVANTEEALLVLAAETATLRDQQQELIAETATLRNEAQQLRNEIHNQPQQTAAAIEAVDQRHKEAIERLCQQQEAQMQELHAMLDARLPPVEAKRAGIVMRVKAFLNRDRQR